MPPKTGSSSSSAGITNTAPFKPPRPASSRRPPTTTTDIPSSQSDDEFGTALSISDDDLLLANPATTTTDAVDSPSPAAETEIPGVPTALVARITHLHSERKEGMSVKAREAMTAYVDVFIREAVARAAANVRAKEGGKGAARDVWVDAEDLEVVAPGLVMDF